MRERLSAGIALAGVQYLPIRTVTFELQQKRVEIVRRANVIGLFPTFDVQRADVEALQALVLQTAFASGALYEMLSYLLVEDGIDCLPWSTERAAVRAHRFATLTDPGDHARLADTVLWLVLDFFLSASASSPIFLRSLAAPAPQGSGSARHNTNTVPARNRPPNTPDEMDGSSSAAITISDGGTPSSAPSRGFEPLTP